MLVASASQNSSPRKGEIHARLRKPPAQPLQQRRLLHARLIHLVHEHKVGTPTRASSFHSVSVWPCTPSAPLTSKMAQSSTGRVRSVSGLKSTCPGVSSSVICQSSHWKRACLAKIVMPRCRSSVRIQKNVPAVHAAQLADGAAFVQERLGKRRLPGVHVRQDAQRAFVQAVPLPSGNFLRRFHYARFGRACQAFSQSRHRNHNFSVKISIPLKTLAFPAFSLPQFGPFPSFFPCEKK